MYWWTGKNRIWYLVSVVWSLLWIFNPSPLDALSYQTLQPGLEYAVVQPFAQDPAKLHLLKVDLKKFKIHPIQAPDLKAPLLSVKTMVQKSGALAAINANFFDTRNQPLGLVLEDGKLQNPPHDVSWYAAFLVKGDRAQIAKIRNKTVEGYEQGVQAGPRLVVSGSPPKLKVESSPKSAVGIDSKGHVVFVVSEGSVEINRLAKFLAQSAKTGGAGLFQALNLDGGSSTQFFAKIGDFELNIPGLNQVPVALGVFKKNAKR
jgi:hypothetical protein